MAKPPLKFEDHLAKAEEMMEALEAGELSLEDSIEKYEEGMKAIRKCQEILDAAEKRIQILVKTPDGAIEEKPLDVRKTADVEKEDRERKKAKPERSPGFEEE